MDQSSQNYSVLISDYAGKHFIKSFAKSYKSNWGETLQSIINTAERIDNMLRFSRVDLLKYGDSSKLVKLDFAVVGRKQSPKKSGNRSILFIDEQVRIVHILCVYAKTDLPKNQSETQFILQTVKENFPQLWGKLEDNGDKS